MVSKYRLIYFNACGIAEPIRYLFAYGKIPYEDVRLEFDEWKNYKSGTPFGQVPVLQIDGKTFCQNTAICRHLAKKVNLLGKTEWDIFSADSIVDTITDFRLNYAAYFKMETDSQKSSKLIEIKEIHNPYYFVKFEKIVEENGGYFVNNQLTWADIFFSAMSEVWIKTIQEPILSNYPNLRKLKQMVDSEPNIKAYLDKRPETLY